MGKEANDAAHVTRSSREPSTLTTWSAKDRPVGSWRFDEKTICSLFGRMKGAKLAAPARVIWRTPVPSARMR
jgi:hypothetical protein